MSQNIATRCRGKMPLIFSFILIVFSLLLHIMARKVPGFAEWYAVTIYPIFVNTYGRFLSLFPVSVVEIAIYFILSFLIVSIIIICVKVTQNKINIKQIITKAFTVLFVSGSLMFLTFTLFCGINYHRDPFSKVAGFTISNYSVEELGQLCVSLVEEINEASKLINRDADGMLQLDDTFGQEAMEAMKALGEKYPALAGYYPRPKPVLFSKVLSYQFTMGVYSAFTMEANYNKDMPVYSLPDTMCHELSHLKGFMREDEAEFIAYLACRSSNHPAFRYSGAMEAFGYAMNAFYKEAGSEAYFEIYNKLDPEVIKERQAKDAWWKQYEGPVKEISNKATDVYLKANNQTDGMKSYGRVVDLLLEDFLQRQSDAS